MAGSTFGTLFRVTTAGESHGAGNVVIVDGCPPGLALSTDDLIPDLRRRRPGQSRIVSPRHEDDAPEILSGVFEGKTTGTPIAVLIRNTDQRSQDYGDIKDKYRPGHADYTFDAKYGFRDYRGGGRSSARETTARVAAGAIAKKLLHEAYGIRIVGMVDQVGDLRADIPDPAAVTLEQVEANPVRCPDPQAAAAMEALIKQVRKEQDSIGGAAMIVASNVPAGWGEPVFDKLKADLGKAMFSLPAVLGVEYGQGFAVAHTRGSEHSDTFVPGEVQALHANINWPEYCGDRDGNFHVNDPEKVNFDNHWYFANRTAAAVFARRVAELRRAGELSDHEIEGDAVFQNGGTVIMLRVIDRLVPVLRRQARAIPGNVRKADYVPPSDMFGDNVGITTSTNRHGGMLGGISSGLPIVLRCAVKPTSSIPQERPTVTRTGEPTTIATKGRHDPCLLPRFVPMAEAMVALVLADHMLRQRAVDLLGYTGQRS